MDFGFSALGNIVSVRLFKSMDVGVVVLVGCFGKERSSGSARFHQPWRLFYSQLLYYSYSLLHWFLSQIDTLFPSSYCTAMFLSHYLFFSILVFLCTLPWLKFIL
ncbi:hypothetical protein ES332_D08G000100v1 [Gossypium tomentosum]|uniref:Uncharacterized protein n=1 Tax=Gossypium tomentosum TaxID=34277 RepID=A0A5D2JNV7_GOSTO|nr:hypothetical protein ES332_D08G000100v1 [Gossypium tomentosum]